MARATVLRLKSYAKVNLGLEVLGPRHDGYHELRTLFQTVDLADDLELRACTGPTIELRCAHPLVPKDEGNGERSATSRTAPRTRDSFSRPVNL